ncbi:MULTISPECIES: helix-turn-helix transcriptional regulator [Stenotrophomonas]|uniref:helix-turn-helix transcriptional regulator n=1 Tax=Stenotrophomonas TaxID=40323 RepID=UPI000C1C40DD|nr:MULTISPECIES: helix-turn-helix domain-containing protein [Stenotrophomonas]MBK0027899.1 helix-turn-helix domain-containing protein [Stenotrophomonas sp. S48]MBK0049442.1 helix-turn-helix domain-containing protein [Stenotrophomonas sp. S49]MBN5137998.1 helix-turn-helix domain-containing protein [Stenotrophomonas maltophilia]MDZ5831370.1 helix-turn-helix domain-containing protein [Stenotrophomonas maltophilia]HEL4163321.1 helix-turn-helix domain-containing protein [Stenotrophomonas maltophili
MKSATAIPPERFKGVEAAAYLGISKSTLEKMRANGRGPRYVRLGRQCFYRRTDLDAYIGGAVVETTDSRGQKK